MATSAFMQIGNALNGWLLRSPLHGMMSGNTLLITVRGRKSGNAISTPVNYVRVGEDLSLTSVRDRQWWRNMRGGATVTLVLQGRERQGTAALIEDPVALRAALADHLRAAGAMAKYLGAPLDASGNPAPEDVERLVRERVVVRVVLNRL